MEGRVHIDAVWMVQLVHVTDLPERAVRQLLQPAQVGEPVQVIGRDIALASDGALRTPRQGNVAVTVPGAGIADVRADIEVVRVARLEPGTEDFGSARIHTKQCVLGVQKRVLGTEVSPHRRQTVPIVAYHDFRRIYWCHRVVECLTWHGPGQVPGQFALWAPGCEVVRFDACVTPPFERIAELVGNHLGEIVLIELVRSLAEWLLGQGLIDIESAYAQLAVVDVTDHVVETQTAPVRVVFDDPNGIVGQFDRLV
ncbi:hypothetical protein [Nocardia sp. NPDC047654]|uniref:hypothetical protein n=1 Tax=Nocardia sp. NPDC047654 TaxID=3364314 RepID=UPI00370FB6E4